MIGFKTSIRTKKATIADRNFEEDVFRVKAIDTTLDEIIIKIRSSHACTYTRQNTSFCCSIEKRTFHTHNKRTFREELGIIFKRKFKKFEKKIEISVQRSRVAFGG